MFEEHECKGCSTIFKILSILFILETIFLVSVSYVYLREYYSNAKHTFDETNNTYIFKSEFVALYTASAYSTVIFIIYILFMVLMLCGLYVC